MRRVVGAAVAAVVALVVVGLLAFEPWRAFTDSTIVESLPAAQPIATSAITPEPAALTATGSPRPAPAPVPAPDPPAGPVTLASGRFVDAEHGTDGVARVVQLADGRRFVTLEDLDTSDGPDLDVLLSSAPSGGSWGSYDDGRHVALGVLKANHGTHHYEIPADADLTDVKSVVIWCDRFDVAFGTAPVDLG